MARHIDAAEPREGTKAKLVQDPHPTERGMLVTIPRPRMTQQGQRFDVFRLFVNQLRQVARHIDAAEPREGTKQNWIKTHTNQARHARHPSRARKDNSVVACRIWFKP